MIDLTFLNNLRIDKNKLIAYGFTEKNGNFVFTTKISDEFEAVFRTDGNLWAVDVTETGTNDKLQLFYLSQASGAFIGEINGVCEKIAEDIAEKCFSVKLHGETASAVSDYILSVYGDKLENLWKKFPSDGIWRRADNKKWYALIMVVDRNKIDKNLRGNADVLDLRADKANIDKIIDNKSIYPGYHMNKRSWISVFLDGTLPLDVIFNLIDKSYILAKEK